MSTGESLRKIDRYIPVSNYANFRIGNYANLRIGNYANFRIGRISPSDLC